MEYKTWPCQTVGKPRHYTVAQPGKPPVFINGAYYWPKDEAEAIARELNQSANKCQIGNKYTIGTKRRLTVEQIDHDEHDNERRTPVGTIVEITDIYDTGTPYQVADPIGGGWWLFTAEELDRETEAAQ